ncbi:MAG: (d)CMP kinase [Nanoarchaeota archaeon]|nr:(d)CMP kinase [Nanoarchaeota archaeon]
MIITIDGPSWTGKSTVAKALAKMLQYTYLNTGAMFRAVGYTAKEKEIPFEDIQRITAIAKTISFQFKQEGEMQRVFVDGIDLTEELASPFVVPLAAEVAKIPAVREALLQLQRTIAASGNVVVEGRDTGSIVFPDADWKFYLDASMHIRVQRFFKLATAEEKNKYNVEQVKKIISDTDDNDKNRSVAPLIIPENAIIYDNSTSPTAEHDAIVLWYYITGKEEMIKNIQAMGK